MESEATRRFAREAMFWNLMDENARLRERERWLADLVSEFRAAVQSGNPARVQRAVRRADELMPVAAESVQ